MLILLFGLSSINKSNEKSLIKGVSGFKVNCIAP